MNEQSHGILDAFAHVRDVYRSVSKMLIASDAVLYEHGYAPYNSYNTTWMAAEGKVFPHGHPDGWIQHRAVRQYCRAGMVSQEILTVGAMLWNPHADLVGEPLCIVSFARVTSVKTDDVYKLPLMQAHDLSAPPDGVVRYLDPTRWKTQVGSALPSIATRDRRFSASSRSSAASAQTGCRSDTRVLTCSRWDPLL